MKRIAIIGGGISGLSAAFALEKQRLSGLAFEYLLFEAGPRLGGVLLTESVDGCQLEAGPDSFLTEKPWARELCHELGLADQLIGSNDEGRQTYILVNGKLVSIPDGLMFMVPTKVLPMVFSPLFSVKTKLQMLRECFLLPRSGGDETVASFVNRHYGAEMVEKLAGPLLSGVYGGDAAYLSVQATLPRFAEMEASYGSLGRAMLAARKRKKLTGDGSRQPASLFTSLKGGMQQMVEALASRIPPSALCLNSPVQLIQTQDRKFLLSAGKSRQEFDAVIVSTPAYTAAELLKSVDVTLAAELREIQYTSSVTVNLICDGHVRVALPRGFGFLVPRSEGKRTIATTFVHHKFPHRAPENRALLRCFIGGARNEDILDLPEEKIVSLVLQELHQILGFALDPLSTRVYRWKRAMAQYGIGHLTRLERIDHALNRLPCLALAGNAYRGIGVPDCIRSGSNAAAKVMAAVCTPHTG
jgi:protoporphyrinogen/coproporphyrinogen III oxidase